ncbi:MAG: hypothetical protein Q8K89_04665, partial [Actinomycetota bacterium]|nr:hypothetical protein [Actinomycetota bacterium]
GVVFKLAFLGTLTAAFYVVGEVVRTRLKLRAGGVALTVVGSAMLLFDGWIVIDGYGLTGYWPWAALLLVVSLVYWITEVRIAGGFFGVIGAAAQLAWWWMLGAGLGWSVAPRMAAWAVVAAIWLATSKRAARSAPLASLATVLRWGSPIAALVAVIGLANDLNIGPTTWVELGSAIVLAFAISFIAEETPEIPS